MNKAHNFIIERALREKAEICERDKLFGEEKIFPLRRKNFFLYFFFIFGDSESQ